MRAQTTIDYAVGISVFIIAVAFAVTFVPGMLEPFATGNQDDTVSANSVASQLATGTLVAPDRPFVVETDCTKEFFETARSGGGPLSTCNATGDTLQKWIGLRDRQNVNLTMSGDDLTDLNTDVQTLCWDDATGTVIEEDDGDCTPGASGDVLLAAGDDVPASVSVTRAQRTVFVDGYDATLEVRIW